MSENKNVPGRGMFNPSPEQIEGRIEAKGVSFAYADDLDAAALKEVTFQIPRGSMVGLVGPSGCGKSTLFNLLLRFYDPQKGRAEKRKHWESQHSNNWKT